MDGGAQAEAHHRGEPLQAEEPQQAHRNKGKQQSPCFGESLQREGLTVKALWSLFINQ